jgi:hypothetical protein
MRRTAYYRGKAMSKHKKTRAALAPNRRQVLGGLSAAGALATLGLPSAVQAAKTAQPEGIQAFLKASSVLTGISLDNSYMELAEAMLDALIDSDIRLSDILTVVAAIDSAGDDWKAVLKANGLLGTAQQIALIWYTGMSQYDPSDPSNSTVVTYDNALAWRACSFTKPPANCGGPFGYWYDPA